MKKANIMVKASYLLMAVLMFTFFSCGNKQKEATPDVSNEEVEEVKVPFFKLSLAQWSLHNAIREEGMSPYDFAQKASELGFEGVEYVSQLYTDELKKDADPKVAMDMMLKILKEKSETYNELQKNCNRYFTDVIKIIEG